MLSLYQNFSVCVCSFTCSYVFMCVLFFRARCTTDFFNFFSCIYIYICISNNISIIFNIIYICIYIYITVCVQYGFTSLSFLTNALRTIHPDFRRVEIRVLFFFHSYRYVFYVFYVIMAVCNYAYVFICFIYFFYNIITYIVGSSTIRNSNLHTYM